MIPIFAITRAVTLGLLLVNTATIVFSPDPFMRILCALVITFQIWNQVSFEAKMRKRIAEVKAQQGGGDQGCA